MTPPERLQSEKNLPNKITKGRTPLYDFPIIRSGESHGMLETKIYRCSGFLLIYHFP